MLDRRGSGINGDSIDPSAISALTCAMECLLPKKICSCSHFVPDLLHCIKKIFYLLKSKQKWASSHGWLKFCYRSISIPNWQFWYTWQARNLNMVSYKAIQGVVKIKKYIYLWCASLPWSASCTPRSPASIFGRRHRTRCWLISNFCTQKILFVQELAITRQWVQWRRPKMEAGLRGVQVVDQGKLAHQRYI